MTSGLVIPEADREVSPLPFMKRKLNAVAIEPEKEIEIASIEKLLRSSMQAVVDINRLS